MKKPAQHLIAEVPRIDQVEMTIGIDLGDVWSHYCTLNQDGELIDRGRFRTTAKAIEKWFTHAPPARVAIEAGTHSIWVREVRTWFEAVLWLGWIFLSEKSDQRVAG
jgi:transposase